MQTPLFHPNKLSADQKAQRHILLLLVSCGLIVSDQFQLPWGSTADESLTELINAHQLDQFPTKRNPLTTDRVRDTGKINDDLPLGSKQHLAL